MTAARTGTGKIGDGKDLRVESGRLLPLRTGEEAALAIGP